MPFLISLQVAKLVGLQQGEADIGELMVQLLFLGIFVFGVVRFVRYVSGAL